MRKRQIFSSLNFLTVLVFLGVLFIMVNYLSSRRYARWDLTEQKMSSISDLTSNTLRGLKTPVNITVFFQPGHRLYGLIHDLLEEYKHITPLIDVVYVDPDQDLARARQLVQQFQIEALNVVVFQAESRHKYLSDTELADYDLSSFTMAGKPRVKSFKGEEGFTSAILSITEEKQSLIWFTTGHGEKSIEEAGQLSISELKKYLEQQNMSVQEVKLFEHTEIPDGVRLIVIAGAIRQFADEELSLLEAYLESGGRLFALIDPLDETGLEPMLLRWGIMLGDNVVVDPSVQLPFVSAANLFVTTYTQHPIVEKMKTFMTLFPLARSVSTSENLPEGVTANPLALTSPEGWGESNFTNQNFELTEGEDLPGPVAVATASERESPEKSRIVVIGDSDFIANAQISNVGNRDLFLASTYWLMEQESRIGIGPKLLEAVKLNLTAAQLQGILWLSFLALPFCCGICGIGMWWLRRK